MRLVSKLVLMLALLAMVAPAFAEGDAPAGGDKPKPKPKMSSVKGEVVKVDGTNLIIKTGKEGKTQEVTIATDAQTKVTVDKKDATLADVKPGMAVQASPAPAEGVAKTIKASTPKPPKEKKDDKKDGAGEGAAK